MRTKEAQRASKQWYVYSELNRDDAPLFGKDLRL